MAKDFLRNRAQSTEGRSAWRQRLSPGEDTLSEESSQQPQIEREGSRWGVRHYMGALMEMYLMARLDRDVLNTGTFLAAGNFAIKSISQVFPGVEDRIDRGMEDIGFDLSGSREELLRSIPSNHIPLSALLVQTAFNKKDPDIRHRDISGNEEELQDAFKGIFDPVLDVVTKVGVSLSNTDWKQISMDNPAIKQKLAVLSGYRWMGLSGDLDHASIGRGLAELAKTLDLFRKDTLNMTSYLFVSDGTDWKGEGPEDKAGEVILNLMEDVGDEGLEGVHKVINQKRDIFFPTIPEDRLRIADRIAKTINLVSDLGDVLGDRGFISSMVQSGSDLARSAQVYANAVTIGQALNLAQHLPGVRRVDDFIEGLFRDLDFLDEDEDNKPGVGDRIKGRIRGLLMNAVRGARESEAEGT